MVTQDSGSDDWPVGRDEFERQVSEPSDDRPQQVLLRHPSAPFEREISGRYRTSLLAVATAYVDAANEKAELGLPDWWIAALKSASRRAGFGWLPFRSRESSEKGLTIRSTVIRLPRVPDRRRVAAILLAGEQWDEYVFGSEFGLRIVSHLDRRGGVTVARMTGLTASLPFGPYRGGRDDFWIKPGFSDFLEPFLTDARRLLAERLGLDPSTVGIRGYRLAWSGGASRPIELRGRGLRIVRTGPAQAYEFLAVFQVSSDLETWQLASATKAPLVACALGPARIFRQDPQSIPPDAPYRTRRPTRGEALEPFRSTDTLPELLEVPQRLAVLQTLFVPGDIPPNVKSVPLPRNPPILSNDTSALSAFRHVRRLFERMGFYNIHAPHYFKLAQLPLEVLYRSGIRPGPGKDGQTVNGQVRPKGWNGNNINFSSEIQNPVLEIHLALGMLSTRARVAHHAEPLGFATDPRWIWHEMGHVLISAAMGELEFRFAHSAGDALAAIVADPYSRLATRGPGGTADEWRGLTFPWIFTPRRHDRSVLRGWSWSGTLGRPLRDVPDAQRIRRKGYWSEQILSTSLFRLYLCLGGVTVAGGAPSVVQRKRASDLTIYLIIRAIQLLDDQRIVAANQVEAFVAALRHADEWMPFCRTVPDDENPAAGVEWRIGGCASKVIRWAFEAQGLFPADPAATNNWRGEPEAIDIYIEDLRPQVESTPDGDVLHGPGTYVPVSLDWGGLPNNPANPRPQWFAANHAIRRLAGLFRVEVRNRGSAAAPNVAVRLWHAPYVPLANPPRWNDGSWTFAGVSPAQPVGPAAPATFDINVAVAPGRYWILAEASCAADRAYTAVPSLACNFLLTPLDQLVPGDNNLGLALIDIA